MLRTDLVAISIDNQKDAKKALSRYSVETEVMKQSERHKQFFQIVTH